MMFKRGFTLIEVIVSLAILGIISASFITILGSNIINFNKTKEMSQKAFEVQETLEMKIDDVKKDIRDKKVPPNPSKAINIWKSIDSKSKGADVTYYEVEDMNNNKVYATLVSEIQSKIIDQIELKEINIKVNQGTQKTPYGYGTNNFFITGSFKNDDRFKYDHLLNVVEWYVSSSDFIMPIPGSDELQSDLKGDIYEVSYYYPLFPRDYILVKNEIVNDFGSHEKSISDIVAFKGKNIIFTVTPGAKSGRIGKQSVSKPVFISGLPVTTNLVAHFDAGFLDSYNSIGAREEVLEEGTKFLVKEWSDLSSIIGLGMSEPKEFAGVVDISNKPELLKTEKGVEFKGQYIRFEEIQRLRIQNQNTNGKNITIFAVVRNRNIGNETIFLTNGSTSLKTSSEAIDKNNGWVLVKSNFNSNNNSFDIGGGKIDIAEIIIYSGTMNEESAKEIEGYLNSKYTIGE